MLQTAFHAWERRLASATTDRVVREFDWGLDWIGDDTDLHAWVERVMQNTDCFFTPPPTIAANKATTPITSRIAPVVVCMRPP